MTECCASGPRGHRPQAHPAGGRSLRQGLAPGGDQPSGLDGANGSPLDRDRGGLRSPIGHPATRIRGASELPSWTSPHGQPCAGWMRATGSTVDPDQGLAPWIATNSRS
ncbi:hypothetical protein Pla86_52840 (plasmid) [Planctomycetes bacterium Pla86]|nr:hypothetical protein Pla86_52840 [Planctomycetes bacterium Pla86]